MLYNLLGADPSPSLDGARDGVQLGRYWLRPGGDGMEDGVPSAEEANPGYWAVTFVPADGVAPTAGLG